MRLLLTAIYTVFNPSTLARACALEVIVCTIAINTTLTSGLHHAESIEFVAPENTFMRFICMKTVLGTNQEGIGKRFC